MECKNGNHSCNSCGEKKCGNKHTTCHNADVVEVVRCRDCKWWTKQEDSAQGRCALSGHYPTGYWYCANGERRANNER